MKKLTIIFLLLGIWFLSCKTTEDNTVLQSQIDSLKTAQTELEDFQYMSFNEIIGRLDDLMETDTIFVKVIIVERDTIDSLYTRPAPQDSFYIVPVPVYKDTVIYKPVINWTLEPILDEAEGGRHIGISWNEVIDSSLGGYIVDYQGVGRDVVIDVGKVTYWETELPEPGIYQFRVLAYDYPAYNKSEWSRSVEYRCVE